MADGNVHLQNVTIVASAANPSVTFVNSDTDSDHDNYQMVAPSRNDLDNSGSGNSQPKVIQVQNENGVQLIYHTQSDEIVEGTSGQPVTVNVGQAASTEDVIFSAGEWQGQTCVICGDHGSGYHYSVLSCEGCKGFFKRTVQKNLTYSCKDAGKGSCIVNKLTRNNCQYCRYQKCLLFGMKREAVREDRSPGGKHRVKRPRFGNLMEDSSLSGMSFTEKQLKIEAEHNEIISQLVSSAPEKVPSNETGKPALELSIEELMSFGYTELKHIIEWAKKVPNFRLFDMDDQMALLKSAFMELNVLRLSYRSVHLDDALYFAENTVVDKEQCEAMGWGQELVQATLEFAVRLKDLVIDNVEFAIMNAIVLTYPDAIGLSDKGKVTMVQTKFLDVLRRYVCLKYPNDKGRFGKLLLRLPTLRTLSAKAAERFLSLTLEGVLPLNELVHEMMC